MPAPAELASIGTMSPASERASTAEKVSVSTQRAASPRACFIGLPASRQIVRAKVSARSATRRAARSSTAARSAAGGGRQVPQGARDRRVDLGGPADGDRGDRLAGVGVDDVEIVAGPGEGPVQEHPRGLRRIEGRAENRHA